MKANKILICAHPDDESIFFGGLLLQHPGQFKVVLVTDASADGRGSERMEEFKTALTTLGVSEFAMLGFPDIYEKRINHQELEDALKSELSVNYKEVYTHNILGEYGHPHHQDVSYVVHKLFSCPVFSTAYNSYPEKLIKLTEDEFKIKSNILTSIYGEETRRFLNLLPINSCEGFQETSMDEIENIYNYIVNEKDLSELKKFDHLRSYLIHIKNLNRPF